MYNNEEMISVKEISKGIALAKNKLITLNKNDFINKKLSEVSTYFLKKQGKLMRPGLVFFGVLYSGNKIDEFVDLAVSIELLHTSSLIHDDLIDKDYKRRGINTTHVEFGNELAILAGDALISKAIQNSAKYGKEVINYMSSTAMKMSAGEVLDFEYQKLKKIPNLAEYIKISELKSASLIATSAAIAPYYKNSEAVKELEIFGLNFGLAFQIKDDFNDYINENFNNDLERYRPNIISSLINEGNSEEKSLDLAKQINKKYLGFAVNSLKKNSDNFLKYLKIAEI
ncbi:MAG: polyprenyl synthetase family protein [Candidatus Micrarchaeaceae archaeon]